MNHEEILARVTRQALAYLTEISSEGTQRATIFHIEQGLADDDLLAAIAEVYWPNYESRRVPHDGRRIKLNEIVRSRVNKLVESGEVEKAKSHRQGGRGVVYFVRNDEADVERRERRLLLTASDLRRAFRSVKEYELRRDGFELSGHLFLEDASFENSLKALASAVSNYRRARAAKETNQ